MEAGPRAATQSDHRAYRSLAHGNIHCTSRITDTKTSSGHTPGRLAALQPGPQVVRGDLQGCALRLGRALGHTAAMARHPGSVLRTPGSTCPQNPAQARSRSANAQGQARLTQTPLDPRGPGRARPHPRQRASRATPPGPLEGRRCPCRCRRRRTEPAQVTQWARHEEEPRLAS